MTRNEAEHDARLKPVDVCFADVADVAVLTGKAGFGARLRARYFGKMAVNRAP